MNKIVKPRTTLVAGFLKSAFELVRGHGGVCISDEVQTGFGRTGEHFWGFEGHDVVPDMVTMAKGMGNGYPMAAVVTTPAVAKTMAAALHFNTFGGNPVASAVGIAVLDVKCPFLLVFAAASILIVFFLFVCFRPWKKTGRRPTAWWWARTFCASWPNCATSSPAWWATCAARA